MHFDNDQDRRAYADKLAHYANRKPKAFLQLDAFHPSGPDSVMHADAEGDCIMITATTELMRGADVRVLIPHNCDPQAAARQLRKIADTFAADPAGLLVHAKIEAVDDELIPF